VRYASSWYADKQIFEGWQSLVHVCRRWRSLVLASPRRLNLRLFCTPGTPAKDTLDAWPALPLVVYGNMVSYTADTDIIAARGQSNRVCQVDFYIAGWQLEQVLAAMQVPFPELTGLSLRSYGKTLAVIPDSFLDGSAPCLQDFTASPWMASHLPDCQNCLCLLITLSPLGSLIFLIPAIFHPKRSLLSSRCCPASKHFTLDSDSLNLSLTGKCDVRLHPNDQLSPPSHLFISKRIVNIQRTS
jgi:hypothetical protein